MTVVGAIVSLFLSSGTGIAAATPENSSTATFVVDMNRASGAIPMPRPTLLRTTTHLFKFVDFVFTPVTSDFVPRAPAKDAWRDFNAVKQSTASYRILLARIHPNNPEGSTPPFKSQNVWVVVARHVASLPARAPQPNAPQPPCGFGWSITVVNANSGKVITDVYE
jgi:hypothetical protein